MNDKISIALSVPHWDIIGRALGECQYKLVQPIMDDIGVQMDAHKKAQEEKKD